MGKDIPHIDKLTPETGPKSGDNSVVITGSYFLDVTKVLFGDNRVDDFTSSSDGKRIDVHKVPKGAAAGQVDVVVWTDHASNAKPYTYE
ncbi:IPT/TIG domain-containing protein [Streptomyces sp. NPDC057638]|uniref:IPT/TIG domain-containing protein n=1 Tax=Streptomyces sp. NPDC057638 TaxID=3346190 RepID=UPI003689D0B2